jgi:AcrR family transcriptional regulator
MGSEPAVDLREACVREALRIIGERGVEGLSIREVARRLGVSHQAPYKHFASSDHLLAEVVRRTFAEFSARLDARPAGSTPEEDLRHMGEAYLRFAAEQPLHYRLMFGTRLPKPEEHPEMLRESRHAFSLLVNALQRLHGKSRRQTQLDALFVWSTIHGMATILETDVMAQTGLSGSVLRDMHRHALDRVGQALAAKL